MTKCTHKQLMTACMLAGTLMLGACTSTPPVTKEVSIVPITNHLEETNGAFVLKSNTSIGVIDAELIPAAEYLADMLSGATGYDLKVKEGEGTITLALGDVQGKEGAYTLTAESDKVNITGNSYGGVIAGIESLRQLFPPQIESKEIVKGTDWAIPAVNIQDAPRFEWRGIMLDVSRHFYTIDEVKELLDVMALYKMNKFHWHLTDDQGWRIEIKKYPLLTEKGAWRKFNSHDRECIRQSKTDNNPDMAIPEDKIRIVEGDTLYGGYYTQEDIKDVIAYAKIRGIDIIPEIDMPGHMQAALAAYPNLGCTGGPYEVWKIWGVSEDVLCAGNDETLKFIEDVLGEIIQIFPSEYIHVGGDECPKVRWAKCPKCQARIKALGLKSDKNHTAEERLQSFIINHAEKFLNGHGRQIIGWDEILEGGLAPNATVMSWRGVAGGIEAAKQKHDVIMTPNTYLYFDYYQTKDIANEPEAIGGYVPVETVYNYEPMPADLTPEEQKYIIGVQANLWTEYIPTYSQVEYMELPRMAALSEIQWTMPEKKNYEGFLKRLPQLVDIYDVYKYNYAKHVFDVNAVFTPNPKDGTLDVTLSTIDNSPIYYTLDGTEPSAASQLYTETLKLKQNCTFKAITVRPAGNSRVVTEEIAFNKASMKPVTMLQPVNKQYEFKGAPTLVDGLKGNGNYKTGRWIAFYKNDMEAVIDMQQPTEISSASISTCVEKGDWVFDARAFSVAVSEDGKNFKEIASEKYPAMKQDDKNGVFNHTLTFDPVTARYVKVTALAEHSIPAWHGGKGNPAFLFVDEISLN